MITKRRELEQRVFETGTTEAPSSARRIQVGPLSAVIDSGALCDLRYGSIEVVRQIGFPIRDTDWGTFAPRVMSERLDEHVDHVHYEQVFEVGDGGLQCRVVFELHADGSVSAIGDATAREPFPTNRSGFTVLHPLAGVTGQPVLVTSPDGTRSLATMPDTISPGQPIKNIAGLSLDIDDVTVDMSFTGEIFEMEDQRNWSDASFKTYCRPLTEASTFEITDDEPIHQEVHVRISGLVKPSPMETDSVVSIGRALDRPMPELLLAGDEGWLPDQAQSVLLAKGHLRSTLLRVRPSNADALLAAAGRTVAATGGTLDLEIILDDHRPADVQVSEVAAACARADVTPKHVVALPVAFLESYQPEGPWPTGLQPADATQAAHANFPEAAIGVGMLTNFTELNRCRPDAVSATLASYLTHGNAATVHAGDDRSVMQTLETFQSIAYSATSIAAAANGPESYRLGLTAIGMRTNPYGATVTDNPDQRRLAMTTWDPRARGLFGAAWAIGLLAAIQQSTVDAVALAAAVGPFGVLSTTGDVPRPWYDENEHAVVYPIFHALSAVSQIGGIRHEVSGLGPGLAGVAMVGVNQRRLIVTNLSSQPRHINLSMPGTFAILDTNSFPDAVADIDWLAGAFAPLRSPRIHLSPRSIAFIDYPLDEGNA